MHSRRFLYDVSLFVEQTFLSLLPRVIGICTFAGCRPLIKYPHISRNKVWICDLARTSHTFPSLAAARDQTSGQSCSVLLHVDDALDPCLRATIFTTFPLLTLLHAKKRVPTHAIVPSSSASSKPSGWVRSLLLHSPKEAAAFRHYLAPPSLLGRNHNGTNCCPRLKELKLEPIFLSLATLQLTGVPHTFLFCQIVLPILARRRTPIYLVSKSSFPRIFLL